MLYRYTCNVGRFYIPLFLVDAKYRGEIKVLLFNHSDENFTIEPGDRIAQLLVQKVENINFLPVESLDETERNLGGFGSTGK